MILWHLGMTVVAVRYVYRDPAMDLRWVLVGSILPDLIDKPIGSWLLNDTFHNHRLFAHALVLPVMMLAVVMLTTRRRSAWRKRLVGLVIGMLFHLVLDAAWSQPEGFWWPAFGFEFPTRSVSSLGPLVRLMIADPLVWAGEAVGAGYLAYLWRARLREPGALRRFAAEGRIPMPSPADG